MSRAELGVEERNKSSNQIEQSLNTSMPSNSKSEKKKRGRKSDLERRLGSLPDHITKEVTPLTRALMESQPRSKDALDAVLAPYRGNPRISARLALELTDMGDPEISTPENDARILREYEEAVKSRHQAQKDGGSARVKNANQRLTEVLKNNPQIVERYVAGKFSASQAASLIRTAEIKRLENLGDPEKPKFPGHSTIRAALAQLKKTSSQQEN